MLRRQGTALLGGATGWLNTEPLGAAELRGHVVLVNFWTLTCINWLRQLPYVRAWSQAYRDDGLVVVGVHTPEFSFEHDLDLVAHAVEGRAVEYPVAADNDFAVWNAFGNHYWPALYFLDTDGAVRGQHFGEGGYEQSERNLQRLLGISRDLVMVQGSGIEAEADWAHLRSPETYLGYARAEGAVSLNGARNRPGRYAVPATLPLNHWALEGNWTIGEESGVLNEAGGGIAVRFHARDAHLVVSHSSPGPIPFRVLVDGQPPGSSHGDDVDEAGGGILRSGRLYQLYRAREQVREHALQITFQKPGVQVYAFTYG